ncbi:MAG: SpoIIIAH-like family protein [Clostridiales bacterium]|nr:SpoIIIAH-like family protein [Clostridiales bacterium]
MKKMFIIRRKNIIVGLLVALLIVTGYLNFIFNQGATPAVNPKDPSMVSDKSSDQGGKISVSDVDDSEEPKNQGKGLEADETSASIASTFFRDYRFEREQERNKEVGHINSIVDNPNSDADVIKEAQVQLLELTTNMEAELVIENLIKAKGIKDAIVIIHKDNVNVIVDKTELVPEEVAMILDIVKRESNNKDTNNIKIIPKL